MNGNGKRISVSTIAQIVGFAVLLATIVAQWATTRADVEQHAVALAALAADNKDRDLILAKDGRDIAVLFNAVGSIQESIKILGEKVDRIPRGRR